MLNRDFTALFNPSSVAIVGASNDETKYGNWLSQQAVKMSDSRDVHLVNRRGESILGFPAVRTLSEIGSPVDLVAVTVPAASFESAVDDALAAGARAIVGITSGFAELGAAGKETQDRIVAKTRAAGALFIGPNCLGVTDTGTGLSVASNELPAGHVSFLSQSGNIALEVSKLLSARGLGFSRFVSLGNQADVTAADLIDACALDENTRVIALYCEDFGDGRAFTEAASRAVQAGKPVILLTVGGSAASIRGAQSHTGALTTSSAVIDAACRQAGIVRVATPRALADAALTLDRYGVGAVTRRVAIIADGGGHAGIAADICEHEGLEVPLFGATLSYVLAGQLPASAGTANPIDLAGAGEQDITSFARTLEACLASPEVDSVLLTGYFGGYGVYGPNLAAQEVLTADRMADLITEYGKPVFVHTMASHSPAAGRLRKRGIPTFSYVENAIEALAVLERSRGAEPALSCPQQSISLEFPHGYWSEREALAGIGIPFPEANRVTSLEFALASAERIGYPIALKALGLIHKSDSGGVALGISSAPELESTFSEMDSRLSAPGYVVEAMTDTAKGVELIVGVQRDPRFGPIAMVGAGGVLTEALGDIALTLAPVDTDEAVKMMRSLRMSRLFEEFRGRPKIELRAAARVLELLTNLVMNSPRIQEIEINPLIVGPAGVQALDARIILAPEIVDPNVPPVIPKAPVPSVLSPNTTPLVAI